MDTVRAVSADAERRIARGEEVPRGGLLPLKGGHVRGRALWFSSNAI